jgi:hypothetical protein
MQYEERADPDQGSYIVADSREFESILKKVPLQVQGLTVQPDELTSLYDWFIQPIRYCGMLDDIKAIFFLGEGKADLFTNGGVYYDVTAVVAPNRLFKMYSDKGGTDNLLRCYNGRHTWFKMSKKEIAKYINHE